MTNKERQDAICAVEMVLTELKRPEDWLEQLRKTHAYHMNLIHAKDYKGKEWAKGYVSGIEYAISLISGTDEY